MTRADIRRGRREAAYSRRPTVGLLDGLAHDPSGSELLAAVAELAPDVVVTDLTIRDLDGVAATRRLLKLRPDLPVLVLTMHEDDEHVFAALRAGALGYLVKGATAEEIVRALHSVACGEAVYGGSVARRIVSFYAGRTDA